MVRTRPYCDVSEIEDKLAEVPKRLNMYDIQMIASSFFVPPLLSVIRSKDIRDSRTRSALTATVGDTPRPAPSAAKDLK
ncbi:hypothetical protein EVAR_66581_1 [Eumeta japonica]|uniref:Uncharacterized protein n=1 Tax=Eumeta variegata TaxID=151549 RepID=A0A4C1Z8I0_EUMVA|nr:hypothetical protein EVAR_66581_1 [Eumeta japonica]